MLGRYTDSCSIRNLDVQSDLDIRRKAVVQLGIMLWTYGYITAETQLLTQV